MKGRGARAAASPSEIKMRAISIATGVAGAALALGVAGSDASAADAAAGKTKAQATCVVCHGLDGIAKVPDAPNLAGESAIYTARQLKAFKSGERQHQQMSIIASGLSDEDMADLAAWYASLKVTVELPQ